MDQCENSKKKREKKWTFALDSPDIKHVIHNFPSLYLEVITKSWMQVNNSKKGKQLLKIIQQKWATRFLLYCTLAMNESFTTIDRIKVFANKIFKYEFTTSQKISPRLMVLPRFSAP